MLTDTQTGCIPSLRGNLSPGILGSPRLSHVSGPRWPALDGSCGRAGGRGLGAGGFAGDPGFPGLPSLPLACLGLGSPVCAASSRARSLEAPAAVLPCVSPALQPWRIHRRELFFFSSKPNQTKRLLETCLGRDQMPNGPAPSYSFLFCYLSRPVVWGESARGPTPTGGNWLGGGARSAGVSVGVWGSRQNWVRVPVQLGEMRPGGLVLLGGCGSLLG